MTEPDIATPEGRAEIERVVMRAMGWSAWVHQGHEEWIKGFRRVRVGWLYTGDGMVEVKRWAMERAWRIDSAVLGDGTGWAKIKDLTPSAHGETREVGAPDEPTAVALALYCALREEDLA